jgi:plasmid stabilization system protein ParE
MSRLIVSLKAQTDTSDIIKDLASKAGYGVAAAYAASFARVNERLTEFPDSGAPRPVLGPRVRICVVSLRRYLRTHGSRQHSTTLLRFCASFTDVAKSDENF